MPAALLAAALGALQSLAFVHTAAWLLPLLATGVLALQARRVVPGHAATIGFAYGFGWLLASVWWLFVSMHRYGGLPAWMAAAAVALLCAALATLPALATGFFARWRRGGVLSDALLFAALWMLAEIARGVVFTGFPWAASGYAQVDGPLAALAPWLGVYGIGGVGAFLAATVAFGLADGGAWRRAAPGLAAAGLVALWITGPGGFTAPTGTLRVTLLQGNVAQDEKFAAEHLPRTLAWTREALLEARGELVVGPETVIPLLPDQLRDFDPQLWPALQAHFAAPGRAALLGIPLGDFTQGYTNSVIGLSDGPAYRYDKTHLVPFGEFIPAGFRWFTERMNIPLGDFARGPLAPPSFAFKGERLAPNICYEDLFGEELAARFADAAQAPTLLVNVSNIGWFGDTVAIPQHLNISRLRALELQRPMLRATNTGATVVIDHRGVVTASLPPFTQGTLEATAQGRSGLTPFAAWASRFGLWPLALPALLAVAAFATASRRRPRP